MTFQPDCTKAKAFASTFYFFATHNATAEKNKKSWQASAHDSVDSAKLIRLFFGRKEARTDNSTYKKLAVQWLNLPVGRQVKLCAPACRQAGRIKFSAGRQFCASKSPTSCSCKTLAVIGKKTDHRQIENNT